MATIREDVDLDEEDDTESSLVRIYRKPSWIGIVRSSLINLVLPFLNGVFLGFGEIFAHEVAFLLGWRGAVLRPASRLGMHTGHMISPDSELQRPRRSNAAQDRELEDLTSME